MSDLDGEVTKEEIVQAMEDELGQEKLDLTDMEVTSLRPAFWNSKGNT